MAGTRVLTNAATFFNGSLAVREAESAFNPLVPKQAATRLKSIDDIVKSNARTGGKFLITGANSGIGLALAKKLAKLNRPMILVDKKTGFDLLDERGATHLVLGLQVALVRQASLGKK